MHCAFDLILTYRLGDLALQVLVAPSLVANGNGLFLCIYDNSDDNADEGGSVEEIIIPQGTIRLRILILLKFVNLHSSDV